MLLFFSSFSILWNKRSFNDISPEMVWSRHNQSFSFLKFPFDVMKAAWSDFRNSCAFDVVYGKQIFRVMLSRTRVFVKLDDKGVQYLRTITKYGNLYHKGMGAWKHLNYIFLCSLQNKAHKIFIYSVVMMVKNACIKEIVLKI